MKVASYGEIILGKATSGIRTSSAIWGDNTRILAAFFAVFFHTNNSALLHIENTGSFQWWIATYFNSLTPWSIAVFVMMSGAFLLDPHKEETAAVFYKKRASRVLVPLIFWSIFYLIWTYVKSYIDSEPTTITYLAKQVLMGRPYYHMWYLFMAVGLYMFTPFLRKIVKSSSEKELLFLCAGLFILSMTAFAMKTYLEIPEISMFFRCVLFLSYFLAGYLIFRTKIRPNAGLLVGVILVSFLNTGIGHYLTLTIDIPGNYFFGFFSITIVPMSLAMAFLLKRFNTPIMNEFVTHKLALFSFGIYLLHPFFLDLVNYLGVNVDTNNILVSAPAVTLLVFFLSLTASMMISRIPAVRRII